MPAKKPQRRKRKKALMAERVAHFVVPFYANIIMRAESERVIWYRKLVEQRRKVRSLNVEIRILEQRKEHKRAKQLGKELEEERKLLKGYNEAYKRVVNLRKRHLAIAKREGILKEVLAEMEKHKG
mgnify:CR=1 FL=1